MIAGMRVRAAWPRAMQTKDKALFESILARDFTFRAEDEWYERDAYIRNRVESDERVMTYAASSPPFARRPFAHSWPRRGSGRAHRWIVKTDGLTRNV